MREEPREENVLEIDRERMREMGNNNQRECICDRGVREIKRLREREEKMLCESERERR